MTEPIQVNVVAQEWQKRADGSVMGRLRAVGGIIARSGGEVQYEEASHFRAEHDQKEVPALHDVEPPHGYAWADEGSGWSEATQWDEKGYGISGFSDYRRRFYSRSAVSRQLYHVLPPLAPSMPVFVPAGPRYAFPSGRLDLAVPDHAEVFATAFAASDLAYCSQASGIERYASQRLGHSIWNGSRLTTAVWSEADEGATHYHMLAQAHLGGVNNTLVIACRGTANAADVATDANLGASAWGNVHWGFHNRMITMPIHLAVSHLARGGAVLFTGHSLGSAVAELACLETLSRCEGTMDMAECAQRICFIGFASPKCKLRPSERYKACFHFFLARHDPVPMISGRQFLKAVTKNVHEKIGDLLGLDPSAGHYYQLTAGQPLKNITDHDAFFDEFMAHTKWSHEHASTFQKLMAAAVVSNDHLLAHYEKVLLPCVEKSVTAPRADGPTLPVWDLSNATTSCAWSPGTFTLPNVTAAMRVEATLIAANTLKAVAITPKWVSTNPDTTTYTFTHPDEDGAHAVVLRFHRVYTTHALHPDEFAVLL